MDTTADTDLGSVTDPQEVEQNNDLPVVCVIGLGYIGLPTAAILASSGFRVHGVEVNEKSRNIINQGKAHVIEPDLDQLVEHGVTTGQLKAFAEPCHAEVFVLCVPTPVHENSSADLSLVCQATRSICPSLRAGNLVILESTSPPGTTEMIASIVLEETGLTADQVHFAHAPERVLPGVILHEVVHNDRVIGGINDASTAAAVKLYETFVKGRIFACHSRLAETVKLVENASRDSQIAFANELSMLCEKLEIDVRQMIELANRHPRVNILQPSCGVGGHCIAVDPWFLVHKAEEELGMTLPMMRTARETNDSKPAWVVDRVVEKASKLKSPVIACLGATYKPNIDDLRESPALQVVQELASRAKSSQSPCEVLLVEPHIESLEGIAVTDMDEALERADIVVFLVSHSVFKSISAELLAAKIVIDICGATYKPLA